MQIRDGGTAAIAHAGANAADKLENRVFYASFVSDAPFYAFRNQFFP